MTVYAQYLNGSMISNLNDQMYIKRSAQQIGVRSFVTPKIEAWASGSMGKLSTGGLTATTSTVANALATSTRSDSDMNAYQLGTNYWLSKRTNMYAIFGQTTRSQSAQIISAGQNSYGLGVRHTF
jgi:predicted porin